MPHLTFDFQADKLRRKKHLDRWIVYQHEIEMDEGGDRLIGGLGQKLMRRFEQDFKAGNLMPSGQGERHAILAKVTEDDLDLMGQILEQTALIHRAPMEILGPLAASKEWHTLAREASMHSVQVQKLFWCLGMGAAGIRPVIECGYMPGLVTIPPHLLTVIPNPANATEPICVIEHAVESTGYYRNSPVIVHDIHDEANPYWGKWESIEAWTAWQFGRSSPPVFLRAGPEYPWRIAGKAVLPWVIYQGSTAPTCILPLSQGLHSATISALKKRAWINYTEHTTSFDKLFVWTPAKRAEGEALSSVDPAYIRWYTGNAADQVKTQLVPNGIVAVEKMWAMHQDRIRETISRYNPGLRLRMESDAARSGRALLFEMADLWRYRQSQASFHAPKDYRLVEILRSTFNFMVRSGMVPGLQIPELPFSIHYPEVWYGDEEARVIEQRRMDVACGIANIVDLWLVRSALPDTQENRERAFNAIVMRSRENARLIEAGVSLPTAATLAGKAAPEKTPN